MATLSNATTKMLNHLSIDRNKKQQFQQDPDAVFDEFGVPAAERTRVKNGRFGRRPAGNECVFFILGGATGGPPVRLSIKARRLLRATAESAAKKAAFEADPNSVLIAAGISAPERSRLRNGSFVSRPAGNECVFFIVG